MIDRGAELAAIGNCSDCHTKDVGVPYAGGRALPAPFGTIYASNLTPDLETGIGTWSEEAFFAERIKNGAVPTMPQAGVYAVTLH
jgi:mono/diheme cytochrome c family protein